MALPANAVLAVASMRAGRRYSPPGHAGRTPGKVDAFQQNQQQRHPPPFVPVFNNPHTCKDRGTAPGAQGGRVVDQVQGRGCCGTTCTRPAGCSIHGADATAHPVIYLHTRKAVAVAAAAAPATPPPSVLLPPFCM